MYSRICFWAFAVLFTVSICIAVPRYISLKGGIDTTGVVKSLEADYAVQAQSDSYHAVVEINTGDKVIELEDTSSFYRDVRVGDKINVVYRPKSGDFIPRSFFDLNWPYLIAAFFLLVALLLFYTGFWAKNRYSG